MEPYSLGALSCHLVLTLRIVGLVVRFGPRWLALLIFLLLQAEEGGCRGLHVPPTERAWETRSPTALPTPRGQPQDHWSAALAQGYMSFNCSQIENAHRPLENLGKQIAGLHPQGFLMGS